MISEFVANCEKRIEKFAEEKGLNLSTKKEYKESEEETGLLYSVNNFKIELKNDQITMFGKYNSRFYEMQDYDNFDELVDAFLPDLLIFYNNPHMVKHPLKRLFKKTIK